jgi:hypothetical protein
MPENRERGEFKSVLFDSIINPEKRRVVKRANSIMIIILSNHSPHVYPEA